ncbi:putative protein JASON [Helianthus annuus]|uniref:Eisosome protein SEG2 n=1 Tax=Helianthus annuus TaxID=4232 RepID=A0A9K3DWZ2_HELAN|nr:uncharacterized protein LOC110910350 isoform X1 [Helianthus annuus]KAF5763087.1 putative protein JASON [Helianthus annuus]KAJ0843192.1 putative protein JASON [Helianthus annuus]
MGCFLGCFGSSKDRKRRKQRHKTVRRDQNPKSQNLVQDDASLVQCIKDKPSNSLPELREIEEPLSLSSRKKVTFDANATTYEHVQEVFDSTESLLERNEKGETSPKSGQPHSRPDSREDSDVKNVGSYPPNYRYGNCVESDDEVEDSDYEDGNDDDLDNGEGEDYDIEDRIICKDVWCESIPVPVPSLESGTESSLNPVLKPVENLTQWKALRSKGTITKETITHSPSRLSSNPQKENSSLNQEIAVDASLSNWIVSSEKNTPNNKRVGYYNPDLEPVSSGKSFSQESPTLKSIEDRPILGALTIDELKQFSGSSCTPRKSPGRSPDDMPIIGSVGSHWSHTGSAQSLSSASSYKGIPNTTSKYREDKKVNWHNTPFETRLERALNRDAAE